MTALLPTAVILTGAIVYFFGVRWGETRVEEYNVASHYYAGILFIINYMLEPYLLLLFFKFIIENLVHTLSINEEYRFYIIIFALLFEFVLTLLFQYATEHFRYKRKSINNFIECGEVKPPKWLKNLLKRLINRPSWLINLLKWLINLSINFIFSRLFPLMIVFIVYGFYKLNAPFEILLLSLVLAFLTFTNFAFCVGYYDTHYQKANLCLKNEKIINGIILKRGSYVDVLTEDGTLSINKDDINTIKVSKDSKELCCDYFTPLI